MEPKVTPESQETLAKLETHRVGKNPLTDDEIERIRKNFIEEDNRTWAKQLLYNFVIKTATLLSAIVGILTALSLMKGWIKL